MVLVAAFWTPTSAKLMGSVSESRLCRRVVGGRVLWLDTHVSEHLPVVIDWSTGVTRDRAPASLSQRRSPTGFGSAAKRSPSQPAVGRSDSSYSSRRLGAKPGRISATRAGSRR